MKKIKEVVSNVSTKAKLVFAAALAAALIALGAAHAYVDKLPSWVPFHKAEAVKTLDESDAPSDVPEVPDSEFVEVIEEVTVTATMPTDPNVGTSAEMQDGGASDDARLEPTVLTSDTGGLT